MVGRRATVLGRGTFALTVLTLPVVVILGMIVMLVNEEGDV